MRFDPQNQEPDRKPLSGTWCAVFPASQKLFGDKERAKKEKKI